MTPSETDRAAAARRRALQAVDAELRAQRRLAATSRELADLRGARIAELERKLAAAQRAIALLGDRDARIIELEDELVRARLRLSRLQSSAPLRAWARIRGLPPLRWIAARRARDYRRELESARGR